MGFYRYISFLFMDDIEVKLKNQSSDSSFAVQRLVL